MHERFIKIINSLVCLGKEYTNKEMCLKVLRSLPRSWLPKVTALMEAQNFDTYTLDSLMGSLATYEINLEGLEKEEEKSLQKNKRSLALKSAPQESSDEESSEDDMDLLERKFNKFLQYKMKGGRHGKGESKITCDNYNKPGHVMAECPKKEKLKKKKKAMIAAWGNSDSESSSDEEQANICLMGIQVQPNEVSSSSSSNFSFNNDDIVDAFEELYSEFVKLKKAHKILKKQVANQTEPDSIKILQNDISTLTKEKEDLLNENKLLKTKVDDVNLILSKFTKGKETLNKILGSQKAFYDKTGLGYIGHQKHRYKYVNAFTNSSHTCCMHCSRYDHISHECPHRYRVFDKDLKWIVKTKT